MSEYNVLNVYVLLKSGSKYPLGLEPAPKGEGTNDGVLKDGRGWQKNCFMTTQQIRDIVHAEDAGKLELKTPVEMRAILDAQSVVEKPI